MELVVIGYGEVSAEGNLEVGMECVVANGEGSPSNFPQRILVRRFGVTKN